MSLTYAKEYQSHGRGPGLGEQGGCRHRKALAGQKIYARATSNGMASDAGGNEHAFARAATGVAVPLARHRERVRQLRLPGPSLAVQLCDGAGLNAACNHTPPA